MQFSRINNLKEILLQIQTKHIACGSLFHDTDRHDAQGDCFTSQSKVTSVLPPLLQSPGQLYLALFNEINVFQTPRSLLRNASCISATETWFLFQSLGTKKSLSWGWLENTCFIQTVRKSKVSQSNETVQLSSLPPCQMLPFCQWSRCQTKTYRGTSGHGSIYHHLQLWYYEEWESPKRVGREVDGSKKLQTFSWLFVSHLTLQSATKLVKYHHFVSGRQMQTHRGSLHRDMIHTGLWQY